MRLYNWKLLGWLRGIGLAQVTLGYLALPMLCFLLGWVKLAFALPLMAMLVYLLLRWSGDIKTGDSDERFGTAAIAVCMLVALLWTAASGVGGFGHQNGDYSKHNAVFKALIVYDWPVLFGESESQSLVYTFGYYLPAAVVGKLFGWAVGNYAIFAWTWAGVCLALLWFARLTGVRALWVAPLFALLSGMDLIGAYLYYPQIRLGEHIEWSMGLRHVQFSSMTTLLYWAPQHALAGWLGAALYRYGMLFGACLFLWSSFAALGVALLMLLWLAFRPRLVTAAFARLGTLLGQAGGAALFLIVLLFVVSSDFNIVQESFAHYLAARDLWPRYLFFFLPIEFGLVAACALPLLVGWRRGFLLALCALLAVIPMYKIGHFHDMAMRASIPALFVFWCCVVHGLFAGDSRRVDNDDSGRWRGLFAILRPGRFAILWRGRYTTAALKGAIVVMLLIGAATPYQELARSAQRYQIRPAAFESVGNLPDKPFSLAIQYLGNRQSFFFRHLAPSSAQTPTPQETPR